MYIAKKNICRRLCGKRLHSLLIILECTCSFMEWTFVSQKMPIGSMTVYVCTSRISFSISQTSPLSGFLLRTAIQSLLDTRDQILRIYSDKRSPGERDATEYLYFCFLLFSYVTVEINFKFYIVLYQKENIKEFFKENLKDFTIII